MVTFQQFARYEKYRIAHEWRQGRVCLPSAPYLESERAVSRLFAAWFAESDWDDPAAAWSDWDSRVRDAGVARGN